MAAGTIETVGDGKDSQASRSPLATRKIGTGQSSGAEHQRFFLAKPAGSNGLPEFSKEFPGEPEAMVESLKSGLTYFVVSEWRGIPIYRARNRSSGARRSVVA